MTNKEILIKSIEKAYKNGFKCKVYKESDNSGWIPTYTLSEIIKHLRNKEFINSIEIIFSHDFAKAFFGEKQIDRSWKWVIITDKDTKFSIGYFTDFDFIEINKGWQYHLQQMVLEEDPLKYLEKFL